MKTTTTTNPLYDIRNITELSHPEKYLEKLLQNPIGDIDWARAVNRWTRRILNEAVMYSRYDLPAVENNLIPLLQRARTAIEQYPPQTDEEKRLREAYVHAIEIRTDEFTIFAQTGDIKKAFDDPTIQAKQQRYFPQPEMSEEDAKRFDKAFKRIEHYVGKNLKSGRSGDLTPEQNREVMELLFA